MADEKKETETKKRPDEKGALSDLETEIAPQDGEQVKGGTFLQGWPKKYDGA